MISTCIAALSLLGNDFLILLLYFFWEMTTTSIILLHAGGITVSWGP